MEWHVGIKTSDGEAVTGYGPTLAEATTSLRRQVKFLIGRGSGKEAGHEAARPDEAADLGAEGA